MDGDGSIALSIAVSGVGASTARSVGVIGLAIAAAGIGAATTRGVGSVSLNIAAVGFGNAIIPTVGIIGMNIAILGYVVDANIRYEPVYTIMRNSVTPAAGSMDNQIVACEGTFY